MLEARTAGSSAAAKGGEEALVTSDDPGDRRRVGRRVPDIALERPAEQDAVTAREHVTEFAERGVAYLGLRLENRELAADRMQLLIAEQLARAEAGAIEHQAFRK